MFSAFLFYFSALFHRIYSEKVKRSGKKEFMSVKPNCETYRYTTEICKAKSQSIVECRLSGSEISSVLAVYAQASVAESTCGDGEIKYAGKLVVSVVYEDNERHICRAERGAEFSHRAEHEKVAASHTAAVFFSTDRVTWRREGSGLYISVIVEADCQVYGTVQEEYLVGGEGLVVKKQNVPIVKAIACSAFTQADDEFETDYVGDILMRSENVCVTKTEQEAGQVRVYGEIYLNLCALKEDLSLCSYERIIPFLASVPCSECREGDGAWARVIVTDTHLSASADADKGKTKIVVETDLKISATVYQKDEIEGIADAYSTTDNTELYFTAAKGEFVEKTERFTERIGGAAALSSPMEGTDSLLCALLPQAEIEIKKGENGGEAEGVVTATLVLKDETGAAKSVILSLPFLFPIPYSECEKAEAEAVVCGLSVRQKKAGEAEADATLKLTVKYYQKAEGKYLSEVKVLGEREQNDCAISIYLPTAGDDLWTTAKRLGREPEKLQKSNPELKFPLKGDERIFVYRQKS